MALETRTLVQINTRIAASGTPRIDYGQGLLVTTDETISAGGLGKAQQFTNLSEVNDVFSTGAVYDAAAVWFAGDPPPKSLYVGRWASTSADTSLRGGTPGAVTDLDQANSSFVLDGTP